MGHRLEEAHLSMKYSFRCLKPLPARRRPKGMKHGPKNCFVVYVYDTVVVFDVAVNQTTINRQLFQAMSQLERLQRLRKGDHVPAPLNLQVLGEPPAISEQQDAHAERPS